MPSGTNDDERVENLILASLTRIENKVDAGFTDHSARINKLEVSVARLETGVARNEGFAGRLVPWLMLSWCILIVVVPGIYWLMTRP